MLQSSTMMSSVLVLIVSMLDLCSGNPDAKRLYDDLLSSYNRLIRPVHNHTQTVTVKLGLRLSQIMDLNLKDQILTTNVWVEHEWEDHKFMWDPNEYGGVTELYVPSEHIWLPDLVVYNNADGEYVVTTMTKAVLHFDGKVVWNPPAIFKTYCEIDVKHFPFDLQNCFIKFGSWSYDGYLVDLKHISSKAGEDSVELGMDLKRFYPSVEWDILKVPAKRNERFYPCCPEPYPDIYFNITLRRKTLFYTVNLIIPCVGISYLSVLVFYLPVDSGEKVALVINILLSQTMFFLLISEIIPSTSLAVPLLGRFLLFTMLLVGISVLITIVILNIHYRKPSTHKMAPWVRVIFINCLPRLLLMRVPGQTEVARSSTRDSLKKHFQECNGLKYVEFGERRWSGIPPPPPPPGSGKLQREILTSEFRETAASKYPVEIDRAIHNVQFIHQHMIAQDQFDAEDEDWNFVAMVLDRLFLYLYLSVSLIGSALILLEAPSLYDSTEPIDIIHSSVAQALLRGTHLQSY